jgi:hypothetical protein
VADACSCLAGAFDPKNFESANLGADSRGATAAVLKCRACGRRWLRYFHRDDSDRWWMGVISSEVASKISAETASKELSRLEWYYRGGAYYGSMSKSRGEISLS